MIKLDGSVTIGWKGVSSTREAVEGNETGDLTEKPGLGGSGRSLFAGRRGARSDYPGGEL